MPHKMLQRLITQEISFSRGDNANRTTGIKASGTTTTVNMTAGTISLQGQGRLALRPAIKGLLTLMARQYRTLLLTALVLPIRLLFVLSEMVQPLRRILHRELCWMPVGNVLYFSVLKMGQNRPALC